MEDGQLLFKFPFQKLPQLIAGQKFLFVRTRLALVNANHGFVKYCKTAPFGSIPLSFDISLAGTPITANLFKEKVIN
jgi:hypothetical protein